MSSPVVIRVENLGKRYRLRHQAKATGEGLRHAIDHAVRAPLRWVKCQKNDPSTIFADSTEDFWALRDVSFEIQQGDVVGIIGRNGAGKSTLLKVLSRITEPTHGRIGIKGRIASLLEVGTGFHPELTGRENIFLNGAILGMTRAEVKNKFDEIIDFAGVERFLDTPVKRYSSGMYVRLAFAVAAHLEPEILVVDEVLAVGDNEFQKKCLGKMQDVASHGRTVLFVSHNMEAVSSLTTNAILLDKGKVSDCGLTTEIIASYLNSSRKQGSIYLASHPAIGPSLRRAEIITSHLGGFHGFGQTIELRFEIENPTRESDLRFSFQICDNQFRPVTHLWTDSSNFNNTRIRDKWNLICTIPKPRLYMGSYTINTYLAQPPGGTFFEHTEGICSFEVKMLDQQREFPWMPGACQYIEDAIWNNV